MIFRYTPPQNADWDIIYHIHATYRTFILNGTNASAIRVVPVYNNSMLAAVGLTNVTTNTTTHSGAMKTAVVGMSFRCVNGIEVRT